MTTDQLKAIEKQAKNSMTLPTSKFIWLNGIIGAAHPGADGKDDTRVKENIMPICRQDVFDMLAEIRQLRAALEAASQ